MFTKTQLYVLSLVRKRFGTEGDTLYDISADEWKEIVRYIKRNGIMLTVYSELPENIQSKLLMKHSLAVKQSMLQDYEGQTILKELSDSGFDCIALKGWELRRLYPDIAMRQMADIDILVKPYDYGRIGRIMTGLGFVGEGETSWMHDNFIKDKVTVEVHKRLTDDSGVIRQWEKGIWQRARKIEGNIYEMSAEDFYIYHFVHLYKDFVNGSLGLRRILDTWLLQKTQKDMSVIEAELGRMGITLFHERMTALCRACMGEIPMDGNSEIMLEHAFEHGIYGTETTYKVSRIAAMSKKSMRSGKIVSFVSAIFLPYRKMKAQFPKLEKYPFLLPWFWIKRILQFLKGDTKRYKKNLNYSKIDKADYQEMKRFFEAGGVSKS